jgi:hypothetical protein
VNAVDSRPNAIFKCLKKAPFPPCCNRVAIRDEDSQLLVDMEENPYLASMSDLRPYAYDTKERISATIYCKMSEQI